MDIDKLLKNALESQEQLDDALKESVKQQIIKEEQLNKNVKRSFGGLAAGIAVALIISTTVFATGLYLGGFDRLREIIGDQRAEILYPVEIAAPIITATPGTAVQEKQAINNIHAELVAVGVFDNVVDIYIKLQDLTGNRLDNYFQLNDLVFSSDAEISAVSFPQEIINRDNGIVTIRNRQIFSQSIAGKELTYVLSGINYNFSEEGIRPNFVGLQLDFASATQQPYLLFQTEMPPSKGGSGPVDTWPQLSQQFEAQLATEGFPVLQPHLHNIEASLGGKSVTISSMGLIEDRLHIQLYNATQEMAFMLDSPTEMLTLVFGFDIDSQGQPVNAKIGPHGMEMPTFTEFIIFNVNASEFSNYELLGAYFGQTFNTLDINWSATFEVEPNINQLVKSSNVSFDQTIISEVRINPILVHLVTETGSEGLDFGITHETPNIIINTSTEAIIPSYSMKFTGDGRTHFFFNMEDNPLDTNNIISVEVDGQVVLMQ